MARPAEWLEGARPRTLLLAPAPVIAGVGVAAHDGDVRWWRAALALVVALALQVGVNYANDYSDGVRGTDADRVGPLRLVGSGAATPRAVLAAAIASFAVAGIAGLVLAVLAAWWLVLVGLACVAAAWTYTGGRRPYGYRALGEVAVFVFFGPVATAGTAFVQTGRVTGTALLASLTPGLLAVGVLVANNLRDVPGDTLVGKRTLAVVLGDRGTRVLYVVCLVLALVPPALLGAGWWTAILVLAAAVAVRPVVTGASGRALIPTLRTTGQLAVLASVVAAAGLADVL